MLDRPIRSIMEHKKYLAAPPDTSVSDAAKLMAKKNVGAILVVEDEHLVGIFTERDALFRVIAHGRDAKTTPVRAVMTADPEFLDPTRTYGHALLLMQEHGFRHVPVVENGRPIGIISSRNAMDPELEEFVSEERRRLHHRL